MDEKEYWKRFRERYSNKTKRIAVMTSAGSYVEIDENQLATFDSSDRIFLVGEIADYIYDLEDIREESITVFNKYNKLLKKYNNLKARLK